MDNTTAIGRRIAAPAAVASVLLVVAVVSFAVPGETTQIAGVLALAIGHGTAGVLMFRRSKDLPARERRPWRLLSTALLISILGVLVVGALGENAPVIGPPDVFFVGAYACLLVALGLIAAMDPEGPPWGLTMLDVAVGAIAAAAIIWEIGLAEVGAVEASPIVRVGLSIYPILDVAILVGLFLVAFRRSHFRLDPRILLLGVGMVVQVVADVLYLRAGLNAATFSEAEPLIGLWLITSALYVLAASVVDRSPGRQEFPERQIPLWAMLGPYLLAAALIPIHVVRIDALYSQATEDGTGSAGERVVLYALLVVGVLVLMRQLVAIRANRTSVERQRRELISSVSHELRTPLTAVMGFLHVLQDDPHAFSDAERASIMHEVTTQTTHMSRTVTDLITLARDGGSTMRIRRIEADLRSIVAEAAVQEMGVDDATIDVAEETVNVDPERITQAVGHLLANARKYSNGRIHLWARTRNGTLTIEVHDDGPGIQTRHLGSIWDQFERGGRRLDSTNPGLGIGLAIVRAVAVAHGGTASYRRSGALGGSCFSIIVPTAAVAGQQATRVDVESLRS